MICICNFWFLKMPIKHLFLLLTTQVSNQVQCNNIVYIISPPKNYVLVKWPSSAYPRNYKFLYYVYRLVWFVSRLTQIKKIITSILNFYCTYTYFRCSYTILWQPRQHGSFKIFIACDVKNRLFYNVRCDTFTFKSLYFCIPLPLQSRFTVYNATI